MHHLQVQICKVTSGVRLCASIYLSPTWTTAIMSPWWKDVKTFLHLAINRVMYPIRHLNTCGNDRFSSYHPERPTVSFTNGPACHLSTFLTLQMSSNCPYNLFKLNRKSLWNSLPQIQNRKEYTYRGPQQQGRKNGPNFFRLDIFIWSTTFIKTLLLQHSSAPAKASNFFSLTHQLNLKGRHFKVCYLVVL